MKGRPPIAIEAVIVDPPVIFPGETARITIHARSADGGPLVYEVSSSAGVIEPTDEPNVFLWHAPEEAQEVRGSTASRRYTRPPARRQDARDQRRNMRTH
jgi:hypothetical protein